MTKSEEETLGEELDDELDRIDEGLDELLGNKWLRKHPTMTEPVDYEAIATRAHGPQTRRDGVTPYIEHPREVARRCVGDPAAVAVAWLHDVLEDTDETPQSLRAAGVPRTVIDSVMAITKRPGEAYRDYLERVTDDPVARKVKIADILANLADDPTEKQRRKYVSALACFFGLNP